MGFGNFALIPVLGMKQTSETKNLLLVSQRFWSHGLLCNVFKLELTFKVLFSLCNFCLAKKWKHDLFF